MKREKKILLIFLGLSMLRILSEISYLIYLNKNWFNPKSYDLPLFTLALIPVLFLIIVVFKHSKNIQYKSYAILLIVVPSTNFIGFIYFYFNGTEDIYVIKDVLMYVVILFFAVSSIKLYVKHKYKSTLVIALSVFIIRYILYSGPVFNYIHYHFNNSIFYPYYYVVTALMLATSGYVIFNASRRNESAF